MLRTPQNGTLQRTSAKNNTPAPEKETEDIAIFDKNFNGYTARKTCLPRSFDQAADTPPPAPRTAWKLSMFHSLCRVPKDKTGQRRTKTIRRKLFKSPKGTENGRKRGPAGLPRNVSQKQSPFPKSAKAHKKSVVCPVGVPKVSGYEDPSIDLTFLSVPCNRLDRLSFLEVVFFYQISLMNKHRNDNATHAPDQESQYIYNIRNHFF